MTKSFTFGLLTASIVALSSSAAFADYELNILHINDFHSRIESINKYDSTCSAEEEGKNECFGGAARLKVAIETRRAALAGKNVVLLNAGDNFQGSLFYTTYKGAAEAEMLNLMKFDAMTVGNHEFDDSEDGLATFLDKVNFPVISANVLAGDSSKLKDRIKPSIVLDIGGQKIGIVGAVANDTEEISSPGPNVMIAQDIATINEAVQALKAEGVNKIIALTHVGYPRDVEAIAKLPDVDVVVGGHSHSLLSNTDEKAEGPYPTLVDNPGGYKVPVVQAKSYSKYLGDLVVTFDDNGVVKEAKGDPILVDSTFKPDEAVLARIKELGAPIEELKKKVVGSSAAAIEGSREICRVEECSMGNLVADAMLDRVKDQGVTIAFANSGGLRASINAGNVTMGDVLTVLPFQNTLATFQLKGSDVVAALENGASKIEEGAGRFTQVAGLKYTFDKSKPAGSRIVSVEVKEGDAFVALDPNKTYTVAANDYTRRGGDGYDVFASKAINPYDYGPSLETTVADFIAAHSPYQPYTDGRVKAVEVAAADTATAPATTEQSTAEQPATSTEAKPAETATEAKPAETATEAKPADTATAPATTEQSTTTEQATTTTEAKPVDTAVDAKPAADASIAPTKHVIVKGDTLWDIAVKVYGNGELWKKIAAANGKPNPKRLLVGNELEIPAK